MYLVNSVIEAFQVLLLYYLLVWQITDIVILLVLLRYNTVYRMYASYITHSSIDYGLWQDAVGNSR